MTAWSRERPTQEGWYWYREQTGDVAALFYVEWKPVWGCWGIPGKRVDELDGEWQGPLEPKE